MNTTLKMVSAWGIVTLAAAAVQAIPFAFDGDTTQALTWNRPVANGSLAPAVLSTAGTDVPYVFIAFTVSVSGKYDLVSEATQPSNWDNYAFLYRDDFDPLLPLANVLMGNDDFSSVGRSGFTGVSLDSHTLYFFVETGFGNFDAGEYNFAISGPGEAMRSLTYGKPADSGQTIALLVLSLLVIGGFHLRQRRLAEGKGVAH